ncbi:hypothetical protein [Clostridium beijerinckii]|uniref:Uncharacterized protein n=1 Tax=Clostridium beijerinckii TaxID=1520 RepID=A0A9Q5GL07_CLOBE|nr:hypothetical protein [Clostridium beijerinckii]MBA2888316.1 hypothetical protein [Clostridium beijerinckii]MBA2903085.1 hypothetical protein [Clostridium beijerinckii]MBA2912953.1 hypothetical protein [Clostridium beijerinckii]MBA9014115.1 hypothetical protein [Clostridium beijerinckii]NRS97753.1 hypothetical protein [Clostridium beijerinckii]
MDEGIACYEIKDNNENWIIRTVKNGLANNIVPIFRYLDTNDNFETFFKANRKSFDIMY